MKNHHILAALLLLPAISQAQTYTLNWASSFSPAWANGHTSGTASSAGNSGVNVSVAVTKSGGVFDMSNGTSGAATPTIGGTAFTVEGSSANMEIAMDFATNTDHTDITYTFSALVSHVQFAIADIDKPSATGTQYLDQVTVTGSDGVTTRLPTLTRYSTTDLNFLTISGNVAHANGTSGLGGNSASTSADQKGTVVVDFGSTPVSSVVIRYSNYSTAQANPAAQAIAIGNLSFQQVVAVPVHFTYVRARAEAHENILEWQTASEYSNRHFEIEKSNHSQGWTKIGTVPGAGTSSGLHDYSFADKAPHAGIQHYRIRQVDVDGRHAYSIIVSVARIQQHVAADVYPNPLQAASIISFYADHTEDVLLSLTDVSGHVLLRDEWPVEKGTNELALPLFAQLKKGSYVLHLHGTLSKFTKTIKLVK